MHVILQYIDLIWFPVMMFVVPKHRRIMVAALFVSCALMMRLQIELMESTGFDKGFTSFFDASVQMRAIATYNAFYFLYVCISLFTKNAMNIVFMAFSISVFFMAMITSMLIMML
ncbi:MAG: hypothetical protein CBB87_01740 [Micavibrio sp. TMED27]|nr:hypothetical protein [Micavibrio sp.]OUT92487.1 MAG: hypothetical protein CBB87_01740 [Micavibrio sp. TMED27]|tara:strand:+ start:4568 stop:4912 length:345 start_codon:yes stop_codon:yes gene_type:complete